MRIYTTSSSFTTAHTISKGLLNVLAKSTSSTSHQSTIIVQSSEPTSLSWGTGTSLSDRSPSTRDDDDIALQSEIDESNWHNIVGTPHVQRGLRRLAAEARRQAAAGEIEEGGFAVE